MGANCANCVPSWNLESVVVLNACRDFARTTGSISECLGPWSAPNKILLPGPTFGLVN